MRALTARERRLVAVGLLILVIGLTWLLIVGPLVGGFVDRAAQRRDLRAALQRNSRVIASLPALRAAADAQAQTSGRFSIAVPTESIAAESVKTRVRRLAADEGFMIKAVDDLQTDAPAGSIELRADLTLSLTQLCELLRHFQSEDAYVVVDDISIAADRSLAAGKLEPLDVRLEFSTAWRPAQVRS
jgi:general secretion pathway protein M